MTHPNNPAGVKKALQLVKEIPAAQGVFTSAQADMRGRENVKFVTEVTDNATGTVITVIQGRHKNSDPWFEISAGTLITAGGGQDSFPTAANAPGTTFPRYTRTVTTVAVADIDELRVFMENLVPHEGRQIDHKSRS